MRFTTALFLSAAAEAVEVKKPDGYQLPVVEMVRGVRSAEDPECKPEIQLLHIQDATQTFSKVIQTFADERLVEKLIERLQERYTHVKYGLSTFADKPAPLVGYGNSWGVWKGWHGTIDFCYANQTPLQDVNSIGDIWSRVEISGGKDQEENQWDAIARGAVDPAVGWTTETHNANGQPVLRLSLMITDALSHTAKPKDFYEGFGYNTSYSWMQNWYNSMWGTYEEDYEWYGSLIRSDLVQAHVNWSGEFKTTLQAPVAYDALVVCNSLSQTHRQLGELRNRTSKHLSEKLPDKFSKKFVASEWDALCADKKAVFGWTEDYQLIDVEDIKEYPYTSVKADSDCRSFEYPNPSDPRYAKMLQNSNVVPMAIIAPPKPVSNAEIFNIGVNHCKQEFTLNDLFIADPSKDSGRLLDCYNRHYDQHFNAIAANGTPALYEVMPFGYLDPEELIGRMENMIDTAVEQLVCLPPTTTEAPTTTAATTTTKAVATTVLPPPVPTIPTTTTRPTTRPTTAPPTTAAPTTAATTTTTSTTTSTTAATTTTSTTSTTAATTTTSTTAATTTTSTTVAPTTTVAAPTTT
ncbi:MAG: uncharacterized protein KVP18_001523, partial [Porospora cf. gigantea A]